MFMYVQWLFPRLSMALILHSKINPRGDLGVPLNARDIKIIQTNTKIQSRKFIDCNPYSMLRLIGIPWSTDHRPTTAIDHRHRFLPTTTLPRSGTPTKPWKNTVFRDFSTFSGTWILLLLPVVSVLISSFFLFVGSSHLCFFILPYCRKFDF